MKNMNRLTSLFLTLLTLSLLLPLYPPALADDDVLYYDEKGDPQRADNVTALENTFQALGTTGNETWYLVKGNITTGTITINGDVHLILEDECELTVQGSGNQAGIQVSEDDSLTIYAQSDGAEMGIINATGGGVVGGGGAGIGGGYGGSGGSITINGGDIKATGGGVPGGAGIGGGFNGSGGTITINGGKIDATGGGGYGTGGAGIGGGFNGSGGTITINGGSVTAMGKNPAAGIGGGDNGDGGTITIGGTAIVVATGGFTAAGIGGGSGSGFSSIQIVGSKAQVTATGGKGNGAYGGGAGIGSGGTNDNEAPVPIGSITIEDMRTIEDATGGAASSNGTGTAGAHIGTGGANGVAALDWIDEIKATPPSATATVGGSITFTVDAKWRPVTDPEYQWQKYVGDKWEYISGKTGHILHIFPFTTNDQGKYRCKLDGNLWPDRVHYSNEVTLTVRQPAPAPRPTIGEDAVFTGGASGDAQIDVPFMGAPLGMELELSVGGQTYTGSVGTNGTAAFDISAGKLEPGEYPLSIQSPGGSPLKPTPIGKLIVPFSPSVSGANALTVLPGTTFPLGFAVQLSGADPANPTPLTLTVGGASATLSPVGDGTALFSLPIGPAAAGTIPVNASAPATPTSLAIPSTAVGSVTVADASMYLSGDLAGKLGEDWMYGQAAPNAPIAFQGEDAVLDEVSGMLFAPRRALAIGLNYRATGRLVGTLDRARDNPFADKAAQPVPARQMLKVEAKIDAKRQLARFDFPAQEMARLEPGLYTFSIEAAKSGKDEGFGPLALATVQLLDDASAPAAWTMPLSLRASVGQQYQLVSPIPSGGELPELKVKSGDKKIATIGTDGVLTAKKSGTTTITILAADGSKMKCKLTVVPNRFSRAKPLYVAGKAGLFSSTRRLYYSKGALWGEIFLYNRTGQKLAGLGAFTLELYDGEQLIYSQVLPPHVFKTALKHKSYKTYKFALTTAELPGLVTKYLDLGGNRIQAVLRATDPLILPTTPATPDSTTPKSPDAIPDFNP